MLPVLSHKLQTRLWGREKPHWVRELAKKWEGCLSTSIRSWNICMSVEKWICLCSGFMLSKFKICRHLCQTVRDASINFEQVVRNDRYPFLIIPSLVQTAPPSRILNNEDLPEDSLDNSSTLFNQDYSVSDPPDESPGVALARQRRRIDQFMDDNIHNDRIMLQMTELYAPILRVIDEHDAFNRRRRFPTTSSLRGSVRYAN